jgi:hypothetical protein
LGSAHDGPVAQPVAGVGGEGFVGEGVGPFGLDGHVEELGVDAVQEDPQAGGGGAQLVVRQRRDVEVDDLGDGVGDGIEHRLTAVELVFDGKPPFFGLKRFFCQRAASEEAQ